MGSLIKYALWRILFFFANFFLSDHCGLLSIIQHSSILIVNYAYCLLPVTNFKRKSERGNFELSRATIMNLYHSSIIKIYFYFKAHFQLMLMFKRSFNLNPIKVLGPSGECYLSTI